MTEALERELERLRRAKANADPGPTSEDDYGASAPANDDVEPTPFDLIDAAAWHGVNRPVREFLDGRKLLPLGYASILSGAGAVGKTLIALQASVACTSGLPWLGAEIRQGPVLFYSAEEPIKEMHIRVDEICEAEGIELTRLQGLYIIDLNALGDAALITGDNRTGHVRPTQLFGRLEKTVAAVKPVLVFLDNRGLLVTGNENDRTIASMAMRSLQLMAERHQCTIVMLAHPSLTGISTGTGGSGSTAWANTARSVIYMSKPKLEDGAEDFDSDSRVLTNNKANYSKHGTEVNLKWQFNRFVCTDRPKVDSGIGEIDKAERVFLKLVKQHDAERLRVSNNPRSPGYAPNVFYRRRDREGVHWKAFKAAMENLIQTGKIGFGEEGPPSKRTTYLRVVEN